MSTHKTVKMAVKTAEVDKNMVPVVRWLNSFGGVYTLHCCEGDCWSTSKHPQPPYVLFISQDESSLSIIHRKLRPEAIVELDHYSGSMRYYVRFRSKYSLKYFIEKSLDSKYKRGFRWSGPKPKSDWDKSLKEAKAAYKKPKKTKKKPKKKPKKRKR